MESCQILWKRDPGKQSGVKKQMNRRKKHSEGGIRKSHISATTDGATSAGATRPKVKTRSKTALSSRNGCKSQRKSFGGVDNRLTASMQVIGHQLNPDQVLKSPSCPALKRKRVAHRPHTSLGFTWHKPSAVDPLGPPQGFDIAGYVKRCGTAQDIQIGINGRPVNDEYFQTYLEKCERDVGSRNGAASFSDSDEEFDLSYLGTVSKGKLLQRKIPLCWEDQLKIAEPECIISPDCSKPKKKCVIIHQQTRASRDSKMSPLSSVNVETEEDEIEQIVSKTSVTLSWRESCILTGTPLYELNPSLMKQPLDTNAVIDRGKDSTAVNSDDHGSTAQSGQLAEWLKQNKGTEEQEEEIVSETSIDIMSEYDSDDLLGIWFKTDDSATQKMLVKLSFEVFVTATETIDLNLVELSTKAFTKLHPQIVSSTVLVIPIHLCGGESTSDFLKSRELKLTVICDEPRSLLFSTQIHLPTEPEFQQDPSPGKDGGCKASTGPGPMKHHLVGSLEVPEHYCKRRTSYCDQDEDEDKTDLEALTRLFPDLKVMEYGDAVRRNGHSAAPASLPVREDELMKLNSIAVNIRRNPAPGSLQIYSSVCHYGTTNRTPYAQQGLNSSAGGGLSDLPRPLFRPVTHQDIKATQQSHTSYTSIVNNWLTPYMK